MLNPCDKCRERQALPGDDMCEVCLADAGIDVEASQAAVLNTVEVEIARREQQCGS